MYLTHIDAMTAHHKNLMNQAEHHRRVMLLRQHDSSMPMKRKRQQPEQIIPSFA